MVKPVDIGTRDSVKTKIVTMCITSLTVRTTLQAKIARTKVVKKDTERHVEIGTMVAVTEKTNVPTSIKKHTSQEEEVTKTARKVLTEVPLVKEVKEDTLIAEVKKTI